MRKTYLMPSIGIAEIAYTAILCVSATPAIYKSGDTGDLGVSDLHGD